MIIFSTKLLANIYRNVKPSNSVFLSKLNFNHCYYNKPKKNVLPIRLDEQIKFEQNNPGDLTYWKLQRNGTFNQLTKTNGNNTVHVVYFSRSPRYMPQISQDEHKNQCEKMPDYCEFTLENYLFADFVICDGELTILSVNFTNDYLGHRILNKLSRPTTVYPGPDLETLDEGLINGLHRFFEQNAVDNQLVTFIQQHSLNSEAELYVNWLKSIKKYIQ